MLGKFVGVERENICGDLCLLFFTENIGNTFVWEFQEVYVGKNQFGVPLGTNKILCGVWRLCAEQALLGYSDPHARQVVIFKKKTIAKL